MCRIAVLFTAYSATGIKATGGVLAAAVRRANHSNASWHQNESRWSNGQSVMAHLMSPHQRGYLAIQLANLTLVRILHTTHLIWSRSCGADCLGVLSAKYRSDAAHFCPVEHCVPAASALGMLAVALLRRIIEPHACQDCFQAQHVTVL